MIHGASWAQPHTPLYDSKLATAPVPFLRQRGWNQVEVPQAGAVAAYADTDLAGMIRSENTFSHYAVLRPDGTMVSKFGSGPVVAHPIDLVPNGYGDRIYFWQKRFAVRSAATTAIAR